MKISHLRSRIAPAAGFVMIAVFAMAYGHPASERYIPIGQSPGISGEYTYIGEIDAVDAVGQTISVTESGSQIVVKITDATKIWLDRSKGQQTNLRGNYVDCRVGSKIEIKFADPETKRIAEWVKVEVDT